MDSSESSQRPSDPYSLLGSRSPEQPLIGQAPPGQPQPPQRVPSGITGLDTILHGGFFRGSIYLVVGQPGTGKTILSNQVAFGHVASGGRVVFVSVLTETDSRLFRHLSSLSFFTQEPISNALLYISGYGVVKTEGLKGLLTLLQQVVRDNSASMLIIDGVLHAEALAPSELDFKEFIHKLQVFTELTACTVLLLSSQGSNENSADQVTAHTTVDGVIQLSRTRVGMRLVRELEVLKFRGGGFMEGGHVLEITGDGIEVYPRTEVLLALSQGAHNEGTASRQRLAFGVEKLDEMLGGGLLANSATMLFGPPGSGKTLLGLHFLAEGARQQEAGLYFGLNEAPPALVDAADQIGLDFGSLVENGKIGVLWQPTLEGTLEVFATQVLKAVRERGVKRLFIDGLDALSDNSLYNERIGTFLAALTNELRSLGVSTLLSVELSDLFGPSVDIRIKGISAIVDNVIFLRYVELSSQLYRIISILKTRRTGHDSSIREFKINDEGIEVADTFESAEAILTGVARPVPALSAFIEEVRSSAAAASQAPATVVPPTEQDHSINKP